jgi:hypothetical protein
VSHHLTQRGERDIDMNNAMNEAVLWPLVPACAANGISKTRAFALARSGALETVLLGCRRYVVAESLRTLPKRLAATSHSHESGSR